MQHHLAKLKNKTRHWKYDPLSPVRYVYRALRTLLKWVLSVIYLIPAILFRVFGFSFPPFFTARIGHLMIEPDCYVKEMRLGLAPERRPIILASKRNVANQAAISYWKKYYTVIASPIIAMVLRPLTWHPLTTVDITKYAFDISGTVAFPRIQALWEGRPPLLEINDTDKRRGEKCLERMGVPSGTWFVCIHSREGGYTHSANDEDLNGYRNSRIENYIAAVDYVIARGGMCIRMGDPTMQRIREKAGLIDYAHHPERCDWLDLYIAANCRLFLGNSSGAFIMSAVFGVPVACANMVPMSGIYPFSANDIAIPKLYKERSSGKLIPFNQILGQPMGNFRATIEFDRQGIELVENSADEIRDLLVERSRRDDDPGFSYSEEDELLQQRFRALFRPGHYGYGSKSRVGTAFLQKYRNLLP
ncbi:MAG TPA: TIGR04372 family glycosyltransferase [Steroidobacteraceae bacterium]|nr:TIGR04372 family glycosyltransferase [Steroidobacteraceae bacterium]